MVEQENRLNILIYGAGALGQALGCMLSQAGHQVDLLLRQRFIEAIGSRGLEVEGVLGEFKGKAENLGLITTLDRASTEYDYILITTKSYDTRLAVDTLLQSKIKSENVVSLQNGCGNIEELIKGFGANHTLGGRVITGFEIIAPGRINISVTADAIHLGSGVAGPPEASATVLAKAITAAGHPCLAVADIHVSLYAKLLYNCALNPLGAVLGVHYGALAEREDTRKIMNDLISETFAVISALGGTTPWPDAEKYQQAFYQKLIPATYNHRASMLQDLEAGKKTEVDALVGFVCEQARKHSIATPVSDTVAAMVRFKEAENQAK